MKKRRKRKVNSRVVWACASILVAALLTVAVLFTINYAEKNTYKLVYTEQILRFSNEFQVDPYLVASIIHCESSQRADVVSNKGAVGLMQIMPDTGAWIAEKLKFSDYNEQMLTDPEVNIRLGCWYLNYLSGIFDGNSDYVLIAYNAGPNNLKKWLQSPEYSSDGKLSAIPFKQTENYLNKVKNAYDKYTKLYENELEN